MLIKNLKLKGKKDVYDIRIKDGIFHEISNNLIPLKNEDIIEGNFNLAHPPFIEPHIHLDTVLTAGEPSWNKSGTLFEGIQVWNKRKNFLTHEDIKNRAKKAIKWQIANGIQFVRTHVDITDKNLTAMKIALQNKEITSLKEELKESIEIQIVAFPQEGILSYPNGSELIEESLKLGADVLGGIPHFEFTREYGVQSIDLIFSLAEKYNKLIDVHCDEIDDEQSRFLEVLATRAYETG